MVIPLVLDFCSAASKRQAIGLIFCNSMLKADLKHSSMCFFLTIKYTASYVDSEFMTIVQFD